MGGKSTPQAPPPPDPYATARAQTGSNVLTAVANSWLQNANEISPLGTVNYTQTGTHPIQEQVLDRNGNPTGQMTSYDIPSFTRNVSLSPEEQAKLAASQKIQLGMLGLGDSQIQQIQGSLSTPFGFDASTYLANNPNIAAQYNALGDHTVPDNNVFDANAYLAANQDVVDAYNKQSYSGTFDPKSYESANPDVVAAYNSLPTSFNAQSYLAANPDVAAAAANSGMSPEAFALAHWQNYGQQEGRQGAMVPSMSLDDFALQHWNNYGQKEGRSGSGELHGGMSEAQFAQQHYNNFGRAEGRASGGTHQQTLDEYARQVWEKSGRPSSADPTGQPISDISQYLPHFDEFTANDNTARMKQVEDALYSRLNPQLEQDRAALDVQLTNQGFVRGSAAYNQAMDEFNRQANDARMQVTLAGSQEDARLFGQQMSALQNNNALRQAAFGNELQAADFHNTSHERALQEALMKRELPLNEASAILSGGQVNMPQFSPYQSGSVMPTPVGDYVMHSADIEQKNYQAQLQAQAQQNAAMFGAGASLLGGLFKMSDRRVKRDVTKVGDLAAGVGLYVFRYNWDDGWQAGVMADEVEAVMPWAVIERGGVKLVNYGAL